jgi:hypothetical protein
MFRPSWDIIKQYQATQKEVYAYTYLYIQFKIVHNCNLHFFSGEGPAADATDAPQP